MPDGMPEIEVVVPLPDDVTFPGVLVTVHDPEEGNPLNCTLPVGTVHVG